MKKWITWNVNGLRACIGKGFLDFLEQEQPDLIALQEIKMLPEQADIHPAGYQMIWNSAEKRGYSGTAVFFKDQPLSVSVGIGEQRFDSEGRTITLEFDDCFFVTSYTPNAQDGLKRIDYRMSYEDSLRVYLNGLNHTEQVLSSGNCIGSSAVSVSKRKPVILCGDLNVAAEPIDLARPEANEGNPGYSIEERLKFRELLDSGFVDAFRFLYPDEKQYSWFSYRFGARAKNIGWRIDYFLVSEWAKDRIQDVQIKQDVFGSDHCPVVMYFNETETGL